MNLAEKNINLFTEQEVNNLEVAAWKALSAAIAVAISALGTSYAQGKIGSAGAGAIAEKPEVAGMIIALEALPELMVVLGFVVALMIIIMVK